MSSVFGAGCEEEPLSCSQKVFALHEQATVPSQSQGSMEEKPMAMTWKDKRDTRRFYPQHTSREELEHDVENSALFPVSFVVNRSSLSPDRPRPKTTPSFCRTAPLSKSGHAGLPLPSPFSPQVTVHLHTGQRPFHTGRIPGSSTAPHSLTPSAAGLWSIPTEDEHTSALGSLSTTHTPHDFGERKKGYLESLVGTYIPTTTTSRV